MIGVPLPELKKVFSLIDRKDKLPKDEWEKQGLEIGLTKEMLHLLNEILKNDELWKESPELSKIISYLRAYGIDEFVDFDPSIIRGLDYYTGVVFEAWDVGRDGRAILGGGHYDNLVGDVGGNPLPGVGFAMGDVMIGLILEKYECLGLGNDDQEKILVTNFDDTLYGESIRFATILRSSGLNVSVYPESSKLQKQFKYADRKGMSIVVVIGPDEYKQKQVTIKHLSKGLQQTISRDDAPAVIKELLAIQ
jgi:histidyl-tRNA synthetase